MIYEGTVSVSSDTINMELLPTKPQGSEYSLQFDNTSEMLTKTLGYIKPFFSPDEPTEDTNEYIAKLRKKGYGTFYADSQNIHDLINLYANTKAAEINPFPGITTTRKSNEIVFTETIKNFRGVVNEHLVVGKSVKFIYRGVIA